jgi:hypothetical protein
MKKDLFYYLNNVFNKKEQCPEEQEVKSFIWPINRFLSMEKDLLEVIAYTSKFIFTLGPKYYRLLYRIVPTSGAPRNKYLKVQESYEPELLERYIKYFGTNKRETVQYLRLLEKQHTKEEIYEFVGLELKGEKKKSPK